MNECKRDSGACESVLGGERICKSLRLVSKSFDLKYDR
jgi:hypothetical protein